MSAFIPLSLLAPTAPLPNAPSLSTRGTAAQNETSFSRQLEQSRQAHAQESPRPATQIKPPARPPAPPSPPAPPPAASAQRPPAKPETPSRSEANRASRPTTPRDRTAPAEGKPARTEADAKAEDATDTETGTHRDAVDPAAAGLLALAGPAPEAPAPPPADAAASSLPAAVPLAQVPQPGMPTPATKADTASDGIPLAGAANPAAGAGALSEASNLPAQADGRNARGAAGAATLETGAWQQAQAAAALAEASGLQEANGAHRAEPATGSERSVEPVGLTGLTGLSGPGSHAGKLTLGEAPTVHLATPATSAEFRAALGAQVSFFARAGVQQAELHLNPADMGPVSIQIVLDGQQAQVNFGADSALTRQIIESGMPELAGALRDAGLTLTGGGVSQHAGGQRQDAHGNASPGQASSSASSGTTADTGHPQVEPTRRSTMRSVQGGVDLYA